MSIAPSPLIWRGLHPSVFLVRRAVRWEEANMFRENNLLNIEVSELYDDNS